MMVAEEVDIMHRRTIVSLATTVLILAMAVAVTAQGRGFRGGAIFRAAPPGPAAPGAAFIGRHPVPAIGPRVHAAPFGFARSPRTIIVPPVLGYYSPYVWPAPPLFAEPGYSPYTGPVYSEPAYASPAASAPAVSQRENDLAYQVGRLSGEIEQLRQQQNLSSSPPPPPQTQAATDRPRIPTLLVFRDGHRIEIQNYAIVGQTLWVVDEKAANKISIADVDLDATQNENRGRGVRFPLPEK